MKTGKRPFLKDPNVPRAPLSWSVAPHGGAHDPRPGWPVSALEERRQSQRNLWFPLRSRYMQLPQAWVLRTCWAILDFAQSWPAMRKEPNMYGKATHSPNCQCLKSSRGKGRLSMNPIHTSGTPASPSSVSLLLPGVPHPKAPALPRHM